MTAVTVGATVSTARGLKRRDYEVTFEGDVAVRVEAVFPRWRGEQRQVVHLKIWAKGDRPIPAAARAIRVALDVRRLSKLEGTTGALR